MSERIKVWQAEVEDLDFIVSSNQAMALETEGKPLATHTLKAGVSHLFAHPAEGQYLLAKLGEEAVGTLMLTYEWSDWRNGRFWWIQSVFVSEPYRRQGVYSAMHKFVIELSRQDEACIGLRLYVERENLGAQRTYQTLEMHETVYRLYQQDFS